MATPQTLRLIEELEGLRLRVYLDSASLPTVGVGHLVRPLDRLRLGQTITRERAEGFLREDLAAAERAVMQYVKVPLSENQRSAVLSLVFNIGAGAFSRSRLLRLLNQREYTLAAAQFLRWVHAKGRRIPGLVNRRTREMKLFLTPDD